jgi:2-dehydropantoate 2-reductase
LGTILGALITKSGRDVLLVDADEGIVAALNQQGATITGFLELTVPVKAVTPSQVEGQYDLVILLTKQTINDIVLNQLRPHLHEDSTVCTLQNGIPEESVAAALGASRTVGGTVLFGATWQAPGVSALTSSFDGVQKAAFEIGELNGGSTKRIRAVAEVLSAVGGVRIVDDLMGVRWAKLLANATFSGMSAALGCSFGDVLENPDAMFVLAHVADECVKTCRASGHRLEDAKGLGFETLEFKPGETLEDKMPFYRSIWGPHVRLKASMLQDLQKGRKTEIPYINGHVCLKGKQHNVPTPYNDLVARLVREAEALKHVPDFKTNLEIVKQFVRDRRALTKG